MINTDCSICPFMEQVIKERAQPQYPIRRDAQTELELDEDN